MFKKCLANRIIRKEGDYKCYLCHHVMSECPFDIVEEHLLSFIHQDRLHQIDKDKRETELKKLSELSEFDCKKIVENSITFDRTNFLNCHICKCKVSGLSNTLQHINGNLHKNIRKILSKQNDKCVEQKAKNVLCDKINTKKAAATEKTVTDKTSISAMKSGSNGIVYNEHSNSYYCNICKVRIVATANISQHIEGLLHKALESKLTALNPGSKSDCIVYDQKCNSYHCTVCKQKIDGTSNVTQHIQGFMHQTMLHEGKATKTELVKTASEGFLNQTTLNTQTAQANKIRNQDQIKGNLEKVDSKSHFTDIANCKSCQIFIYDSTTLKCHVLLHFYKEFDSLRNLDLIKFKLKPNKKLHLHCLLCDSFICESFIAEADKELAKHLKTDKHLGRLAVFYVQIKKYPPIPAINNLVSDTSLDNASYKPKKSITLELLCNYCNVPVFLNNKKGHISGKNHNRNAAANNTDKLIETGFSSKINLDYYSCFICGTSFSESSSFLKHFETLEHQWKIISLNMINRCSYIKYTKKNDRYIIECSSCNVTIYNFKLTVDHMIGKKHNEELKFPSYNLENRNNSNTTLLAQVANEFEKLSVAPTNTSTQLNNIVNTTDQNIPVIKAKSIKKIKAASKFEASVKGLNQLGFSTENIQPLSTLNPDMADKILGDLVPPDFDKAQIRRLPSNAKIKSPRTPKIEDQRNSFATSVLRYGKTYIKFCIDPGQDNIFSFDNEKINLMKFGVSLTFPHPSVRVCIPCGEQFTNNVQSLFEHLQNQEHLKNICNMLIDDKEFEKFPEQFSDLKLAKLYMQESDQSVQCHVCNIKLEDDDNVIRQHAKSSIHEKKSKVWKEESEQLFEQYLTIFKDIWYYAEVFFCEICKTRCEFEIDFAIHLIHPEHMKKVYELKHKGTELKFDFCPPCTTYWFGKADSYEAHCKNDYHKLLVDKKDFVVPNWTITASEYLDSIDENVDLLISESDKVDLEKDKVTTLLGAIVETVKPVYPNAEAYLFGSRLSYLGFSDSDVDVFLDCDNVYYTSSTKKQSQQYIKSVKSYFDSKPNAWKVDEVLIPTRVPILKLRHIPTNLKCDISFVNGLSVEKSKLVGLYNRAFLICRKLILFMKKWSILCRISGPDCITTFAISWCVIFYLQSQGIFPSVHELIERKMESKIVDGWECGFDETIAVGSSNLSFKEHLKGFFTYFANFDYQKDVVCPHMSKTIEKRTFACTDELPSEMDIYKRRFRNMEVENFRFDSPMCIQDPIDLSQNMTKAVSKKHLRRFRQYCVLSAEKC